MANLASTNGSVRPTIQLKTRMIRQALSAAALQHPQVRELISSRTSVHGGTVIGAIIGAAILTLASLNVDSGTTTRGVACDEIRSKAV